MIPDAKRRPVGGAVAPNTVDTESTPTTIHADSVMVKNTICTINNSVVMS